MELRDGRREDMVAQATRDESAIICHDTIDGDQAVCFGFFMLHATSTLQIADQLGYIQYVGVKR